MAIKKRRACAANKIEPTVLCAMRKQSAGGLKIDEIGQRRVFLALGEDRCRETNERGRGARLRGRASLSLSELGKAVTN